MKEGMVIKSGDAAAEEMEKINRYTRREYKPEEVYTFSLILCDNEIDRDFERFSAAALSKLQELFLGKTCILDHERKSANQTARIYDTALEREESRITRAGEPYVRLTAKAYLPKTEKNRETVELIESGILKEVSISCAVKKSVCGICGKESCSHQKGREYGGKLCSRILEEPTDAYECSFVAVPAQREAGVRKSWKDPAGMADEGLEKLSAAGEQVTLTAEEARSLRDKLRTLTEQAVWGQGYQASLQADILKYSRLIQPEVPEDVMKTAIQHLSLEELTRLGKAYAMMTQRVLPLRPQLAPSEKTAKEETNGAYRI
ncbi:MAG: hypothetical protein J1E06_02715 [Acutalibacter sp.]|nr:hypothetical protein [Acutalibacter sp.]